MSLFSDPVSGKVSMTRTVAFALAAAAVALTAGLVVYLVRCDAPDAGVVAAVAAPLGALVAAGCVAIINRTTGVRAGGE